MAGGSGIDIVYCPADRMEGEASEEPHSWSLTVLRLRPET